MLISNALLVDPHTRNSQDAIFFIQPPCVELVVWYNPEEYQAQADGEETRDEEYNLPWLDGGPVFLGADGDPVRDYSAEDLAHAVEAEPDVDAAALFLFCVPLFRTVSSTHYIWLIVFACRLGGGTGVVSSTWEVKSAKPGVTAASNTPSIKRIAIAPW